MRSELRCQGAEHCGDAVTHLDNKGFIYCSHHGERRRNDHPCRRLLKKEVRLLENGTLIWWDSKRNV